MGTLCRGIPTDEVISLTQEMDDESDGDVAVKVIKVLGQRVKSDSEKIKN
jgi:hypothetical protein